MTGRPFTPEHETLRKSIRSFVERAVTPSVAGAGEESGETPKSFWRRQGELGFLGLDLSYGVRRDRR